MLIYGIYTLSSDYNYAGDIIRNPLFLVSVETLGANYLDLISNFTVHRFINVDLDGLLGIYKWL